MEIRCPHCQNALTIEEKYAGQLMRCPTCNGTFQAPVLPVSNQAWVAPTPEPAPTPPAPQPAPAPSEPAAAEVSAEEPKKKKRDKTPVAAGDYSRSYTLALTGQKFLPWIVPVALTLVFGLAFFSWTGRYLTPDGPPYMQYAAMNMWQIGGMVAVFIVMAILAWLLSILSLAIYLKLIPLPPPLDMIAGFRSIVVAAFVGLAFIFFAVYYLQLLFAAINPSTVAMKVAFRIVLLAVIAALVQVWLDRRQMRNQPPPEFSMRW